MCMELDRWSAGLRPTEVRRLAELEHGLDFDRNILRQAV
jgi:hypothetical protein